MKMKTRFSKGYWELVNQYGILQNEEDMKALRKLGKLRLMETKRDFKEMK